MLPAKDELRQYIDGAFEEGDQELPVLNELVERITDDEAAALMALVMAAEEQGEMNA